MPAGYLLADERVALEGMLNDVREVVRLSVKGLTDEEARRRLVASNTTILGLVQHCAAIERFFFQCTLEGREPAVISGRSDATAPSWELEESTTIDGVLRDFDAACAESRRTATAYDLDYVTRHNRRRGPVNVRWIYLHMIQELARHAGHADILREQIEAAREH